MDGIITGKINVSKITKSKLYEGKNGSYLNFIMFPKPNSEFYDFQIVESISKEERENGVKGVELGDAKFLN